MPRKPRNQNAKLDPITALGRIAKLHAERPEKRRALQEKLTREADEKLRAFDDDFVKKELNLRERCTDEEQLDRLLAATQSESVSKAAE